MEKIVRKNITDLPYSLHDGAVIALEAAEDKLSMVFQYGYISTAEPYEQVEGNLEFEKVDWDFSFVYLLEYQDVLCGNTGRFVGEKMGLKEFINQYKSIKFDIVDETYGYNTSKFSGYFSIDGTVKEGMVEVYHLGDMRYLVEIDLI